LFIRLHFERIILKTSLHTLSSLVFVAALTNACVQNPLPATAPKSLPESTVVAPSPVVVAPPPAPIVVAAPPTPAPVNTTPAPSANAEHEAFFNEAVQLINQYRASKKMSALSRDSRLDNIAATHSRFMAAKDDLTHDGFADRFNRANMQSCAENLAWNQITASELVNDWIASPVHDKNLLKPAATRVGMGRAKSYTTYFVCQP
jgi:uncharacterized protein YkwD